MHMKVKFSETNHKFDVNFSKVNRNFKAVFNDLVLVERTDIPKEYGLITYTQDKIITIT